MHEVTLIEVPAQLVLGLQKRGHYQEIGIVIGELAAYAASHGVQLAGAPLSMMHELGKEAAMKADSEGNVVIDVAFPIAAPVEGNETVKCYELPGGTMARVLHRGPYEACAAAYNALFQWVSENGYMITDPTREVYLNDPHEVKPEELLIEVFAPVAKA